MIERECSGSHEGALGVNIEEMVELSRWRLGMLERVDRSGVHVGMRMCLVPVGN